MATRNRIHKSSVSRRRGATHTHDYSIKGHKREEKEESNIISESAPEPRMERSPDWDEEGASLGSDRDYDSDSRLENEDIENLEDVEDADDQEDARPGRARNRRGDRAQKPSATSELDEFYDEPPLHNNYDDEDSVYPPSWRH